MDHLSRKDQIFDLVFFYEFLTILRRLPNNSGHLKGLFSYEVPSASVMTD